MRRLAIVMAVAASMALAVASRAEVFVGKPRQFDDFGYMVLGAAWTFAQGAPKVIFVCWENPTAANSKSRGWVQDQVEKTWQKNSPIAFKGWQACAPDNSGIRIRIQDEGPHVKAFGKHLNGMRSGMILNDTFENWGTTCRNKLESCVRSIAAHEFGHALGFAHEQNRPDTPGECASVHGQDQSQEQTLTPYDPRSIMNYCNPEFNNKGELSPLDIKALQKVYGPPVRGK